MTARTRISPSWDYVADFLAVVSKFSQKRFEQCRLSPISELQMIAEASDVEVAGLFGCIQRAKR